MGFEVHTFSIRRPGPSEIVSEDVRREQESTDYILDRGLARVLAAALAWTLTHPVMAWRALGLALRTHVPGAKGLLLQAAYFAEAAYLAAQLKRKGVQHLHDHIGENSAAV